MERDASFLQFFNKRQRKKTNPTVALKLQRPEFVAKISV
jgi:hypothetical protein